MAPKRKVQDVSSEEVDLESEDEKPKKARKPAVKKATQAQPSGPRDDDQAFTIVPPSLIVK